MSAESDDEAIELLEKADAKRQAIEIARALISPKKPQWKALAKIVKEVEEEPESIRRMILAYATNVMLGGGNLSARAFEIISIFRDHWYDCGKAGLVASCFELCGK
jgi:hypothetical protein